MGPKNVAKNVANKVKNANTKKVAKKVVKQTKATSLKKRKERFIVQFHRPHTLRTKPAPKCPHRTTPVVKKNDLFSVIRFPLTTESAMKKVFIPTFVHSFSALDPYVLARFNHSFFKSGTI